VRKQQSAILIHSTLILLLRTGYRCLLVISHKRDGPSAMPDPLSFPCTWYSSGDITKIKSL
jgi:hypothetical protein